MTAPRDWIKVLATNTTSGSFASQLPTTTEPVTTATIAILSSLAGKDTLELAVFGLGANNDTGTVRVIGWRKIGKLWVPKVIAELFATLSSTAIGIAGAAVIDTDLFADALANTNSIGLPVLPAVPADTIATALVDISACEKVGIQFDITGTTTNLNALVCAY